MRSSMLLAALCGAVLALAEPASAHPGKAGFAYQAPVVTSHARASEWRRHPRLFRHHFGRPRHGAPIWAPAPRLLPPMVVVRTLQERGYRGVRLVGQRGEVYHVRAYDRFGRPLLLVVDGASARVLARQRLH